jgi:hypothetical protein
MHPVPAFHMPLPLSRVSQARDRSLGIRTSLEIDTSSRSTQSQAAGQYPYPQPLNIVKSTSREALSRDYKRDEKH